MSGEDSRLQNGHNSPLLLIAISWLSQWVLWLAYVNNVGIREIIVGAIVSTAATWATAVFRRRAGDHYRLRATYIWQAVHVPRALLADTWILCRAVFMSMGTKRIPSGIISMPFQVGGNGPSSCGRRALAITYLTFTPNSLVMGFLREEQLLFFHSLIPQAPPSFMRKMGAKLERGKRKTK